MNILELCLSPNLGGLELYMFRSAEALKRDHRVIAVISSAGKLPDHFRKHSDVVTHALQPAKTALPLLRSRSLARVIDAEKIDVIHMHWGRDLALAALAKKLSRRKPALVYTRQMNVTRSKKDPYHQFLYREMDLMLTITRLLAEDFRGFLGERFDERIIPLYYGVAAPRHQLTPAEIEEKRKGLGFAVNDFVVGCFGRLEPFKGQSVLIEAIRLAADKGIRLKGLFVGHEMNAGYRDELKGLAETGGVADQVGFMDFIDHPQDMMQICDCIALTTRAETFGLVLAEAMRAGIAIIGSNAGGVPEIIDHDETGLLFEPDDAASLCGAICKLHDDPAARQRLAAAGKEKADRVFNENHHFEMLEQYLRDAAARSSLAAAS